MFRIKICGITSVEDALVVAQAGADAIGLNFYSRSPRSTTPEMAAEIVRKLPANIVKVGLFVDTPVANVCRLFDELKLDLIQLHGDQPPEFLACLGGRPIMRAFRVGPSGLQKVVDYLSDCRNLAAVPSLVLLDAFVEGGYGGTGQIGDWEAAREYLALPEMPPLVLAGGLTDENVATAIHRIHPAAVDTASGVESRPGRKDPVAVRQFVEAARASLDAIATRSIKKTASQE